MGRQVMYDPTAEARLWKLIGGLRLYPRWYLKAFARLYALENPTEYERVRKRRYRGKQYRADGKEKLQNARQRAIDKLRPEPGMMEE